MSITHHASRITQTLCACLLPVVATAAPVCYDFDGDATGLVAPGFTRYIVGVGVVQGFAVAASGNDAIIVDVSTSDNELYWASDTDLVFTFSSASHISRLSFVKLSGDDPEGMVDEICIGL